MGKRQTAGVYYLNKIGSPCFHFAFEYNLDFHKAFSKELTCSTIF
jgi:hypothetical protein